MLFLLKTKPYKSSEQTSYKNGFCFCSTSITKWNEQKTTTTTWVFVVLFKTEELGERYVHDEQATNYTRT